MKSTPGAPLKAYMRMARIESERSAKHDQMTRWIRKNKQVIKLRSMHNRAQNAATAASAATSEERSQSNYNTRA